MAEINTGREMTTSKMTTNKEISETNTMTTSKMATNKDISETNTMADINLKTNKGKNKNKEANKNVKEGDVFDCSICDKRYTKPKHLPCLHTFCYDCINNYITDTDFNTTAKKSLSFPCPVCNTNVIPPNPRASFETWANQLPDNRLMEALVQDAPIYEDKEEYMCNPCENGGDEKEATHWCKECGEFLCDSCLSAHERMRITSKHKAVEIEHMKKKTASKGVEVPEPCPYHTGRNMEVYCIDHKQMVCVICLADKHRRCEHVRSLEVMASHMNVTGGATSVKRQLQNILYKAESFRIYKELLLERLQERYVDMQKNMADLVERAKARLDALHEEFQISLDECHDLMTAKLNVKKERIERFQKTVENSSRLLDVVGKRGSPKQLFITVENIKKQMAIQIEQVEAYFKNEEDIEYSIEISDALESFASRMTSLGKVQVSTAEKIESEKELLGDVEEVVEAGKALNDEMWTADELYMQIPAVESLNDDFGGEEHIVKLKNVENAPLDHLSYERSSWFTGGTFLRDGRLVLADHNNNSLKVFNQFLAPDKAHSLPKPPWDVAAGRGHDLFVSFGEHRYIGKYKIEKDMLLKSAKYRQMGGTYGIDVCQNYVVTAREGAVNILDYNCRLLRTITRGGLNHYVCASRKGGLLYYTDYDDVICRPIIGKLDKFRYSNMELSGTRGIAVDNDNNVYVCGIYSHNIFKISSDGSKGKAVIPHLDNIKEPYALGIDRRGEKVFVSSYNEQTAITFLQLSKSWKL